MSNEYESTAVVVNASLDPQQLSLLLAGSQSPLAWKLGMHPVFKFENGHKSVITFFVTLENGHKWYILLFVLLENQLKSVIVLPVMLEKHKFTKENMRPM